MRGLVLVLLLLTLAPVAQARSVRDADIGWPPSLQRELGLRQVSAKTCVREHTKQDIRVQDLIARRGDPRDALYTFFHDRPARNIWGNLWYDTCDGGRLGIGVASGGSVGDTRRAVRQARAYLARKKLKKLTRLVAVRSTYRELSDQIDAFDPQLDDLLTTGTISYGIDTTRNTVVIDVDHQATAEQRERLRAAAAASPVNVVLHPQPPPPPFYDANVVLDRRQLDRARRTLRVSVPDDDCGADETHDSKERFAGVRVRRARHAWILTARFRTTVRGQGASTCAGNDPDLDVVHTTVTLPARLGRRGVADGSPGPGGFRFVLLPPVGRSAIRSLVPRFAYGSRLCDDHRVTAAFRGRPRSQWCFF